MPSEPKRLLEMEKSSPRILPAWQDVEAVISSLGRDGSGFLILTVEGAGYVQAAGTRTSLTVELREERGPSGFRHYVLGKPEQQAKRTSIKTAEGKIQLMSNEVLSETDAIEIFRSFYDTQTVPGHYSRRDTSAMFKQG